MYGSIEYKPLSYEQSSYSIIIKEHFLCVFTNQAELLTIIHSKLSDRCTLFSETNEDGEFFNAQEAAGHLLLFISALIPKALASLLTSFILATADSVRYLLLLLLLLE